jgi:hypothetical protein
VRFDSLHRRNVRHYPGSGNFTRGLLPPAYRSPTVQSVTILEGVKGCYIKLMWSDLDIAEHECLEVCSKDEDLHKISKFEY